MATNPYANPSTAPKLSRSGMPMVSESWNSPQNLAARGIRIPGMPQVQTGPRMPSAGGVDPNTGKQNMLLPNINSDNNRVGIRDFAGQAASYDFNTLSNELSTAEADKNRLGGKAEDAIGRGAADMRKSGADALPEVRAMVEAQQKKFDEWSAKIQKDAEDRQMGYEASIIAGNNANIQSQLVNIRNDPMLTPGQKAQLESDIRLKQSQAAGAVLAQSQQEWQQYRTSLQANLLAGDMATRSSGIDDVQAAYALQQGAYAQAAQYEAEGYMNLAALMGTPDSTASLFSTLTNLASFEQATRPTGNTWKIGDGQPNGPQIRRDGGMGN